MDELKLDLIHALVSRLSLDRPLVILDLETTGLNVDKDRIVEMGAVKFHPTGYRTTAFCRRFNPGIPIQPDATAKHGITDADVADAPSFKSLAPMLAESLKDVDLVGYNLKRFDVPLLIKEFDRAGITWKPGRLVDSYAIWSQRERRDLAGAITRFAPDFAAEAGGHSAVGDVLGVTAVLLGQLASLWPAAFEFHTFTVQELEQAGTDPDDIEGGEGKIGWRNGVPTWLVGDHAGTPVKDLSRNYVEGWLIPKSNFPESVKKLVADIRAGNGPVRHDSGRS